MTKSMIFTLLLTTFLISPVFAAERNIETNAQKNLDITIYNNNRALVKDTRLVDIQAGKNELAFSNISNQIIPTSVLLKGDDIRFLENNFNYDVLSYESLLRKSIGQQVAVKTTNSKTGEVTIQEAELIAVNGTHPIVKVNGKINTEVESVLFNSIPQNLRIKPTLVMNLIGYKGKTQDLTLTYLTKGLSWDANYVAQLDPKTQTMNLTGWVALTNNSDTDFMDAHLQVVAGDIQLESDYVHRNKLYSMPQKQFAENGMMDSVGMSEESIADYHLYTLPRKTDILSKQKKQVSLLSANNIQYTKTYTFNHSLTPYNEVKNVKPEVKLTFDNTIGNKLGIALPRGIVRLYQEDNKGKLIFIGEDRIQHTGNMEKVNLQMGNAFDISANAKKVKTEEIAPNITKTTYEVTVTNGTDHPLDIQIIEGFKGVWTITSETQQSTRPTANQAQWTLSISPQESKTLTYTVQEKLPISK